MTPAEKILTAALQKIKCKSEELKGPSLCQTDTYWITADEALKECEKGKIVEARECGCLEVSRRG